MSRDSNRNYVHMRELRFVEFFEEFCRDKIPFDVIFVPPQYQPLNPEDEDDVIPDQHAAFGITRAQQRTHEPAWRDLGLADLVAKGPGEFEPSIRERKRLPR